MTWTGTFRRTTVRMLRAAAATAVTAAVLSGCSSDGKGPPGWTAESSPGAGTGLPSDGPAAGATATAGSAAGTPTPGASGSGTPEPGSTAAAWKVFTDPAQTVSFELPQEWIAQSTAPAPGSLPGAVRIEVKDAAGGYLATLQTGLAPRPAEVCPGDAARPYTVISSVPVALPHRGGEGSIEPHVVFRVIQGYKYFGSYGITNIVGGPAGTSCALQNVVRGPEGRGDYSFADLTELKAFAPDQKVAPAKTFDTLDQAASYVDKGPEFGNVQRMLMSLKIRN